MFAKNHRILLTGASGFLGRRVAQRLVAKGFEVRALVRGSSSIQFLRQMGIEISFGDMGDPASIMRAAQDVDVVVHAAAGTSGTAHDSEVATVQGTQNVLHACRSSPVSKLIYVSSLSVYGAGSYRAGHAVTEESVLEAHPERRGLYSAGKLAAERLVTDSMAAGGLRITVLRLGALYGPGGRQLPGMLGVGLPGRVYVVFGSRNDPLPLLHVDNAADAIVACIGNEAAANQVFNVVDSEPVTKGDYVELLIKKSRSIAIYCPVPLLVATAWGWEKLLGLLGAGPTHTVYRLAASQSRVTYSSAKIRHALGWRPRISLAGYARSL